MAQVLDNIDSVGLTTPQTASVAVRQMTERVTPMTLNTDIIATQGNIATYTSLDTQTTTTTTSTTKHWYSS